MKNILKTLLLFFVFVLSIQAKEDLSLGNEVKEYDKIFERIAEKRVGTEGFKIDSLENPFIISNRNDESNTSSEKPSYILEATMDQRVKIDGSWYALRDKVNAWKIVKISHNSAILQNETERKEIFIRTKDESNIKIFSK